MSGREPHSVAAVQKLVATVTSLCLLCAGVSQLNSLISRILSQKTNSVWIARIQLKLWPFLWYFCAFGQNLVALATSVRTLQSEMSSLGWPTTFGRATITLDIDPHSSSVYITCGRGWILVWWQCEKLCTSGFVDDVILSIPSVFCDSPDDKTDSISPLIDLRHMPKVTTTGLHQDEVVMSTITCCDRQKLQMDIDAL